MKNKVLIYGAGGYMGKLFTHHAQEEKLPFVLGSREAFETPYELRLFSLENVSKIVSNLQDVQLVVNLAGPFVYTQQPFIEACIATQTHYIDIAGEYPEFESVFRFHEKALQAGVMLMPGAGFGVVPTDVASKKAIEKLPDATHLKIAYMTQGGASRGTLKTVLKDINKPGVELKNGKFIEAMPAQSDFRFEFRGKKYRTVYNPWRADLFTAQQSTGIQNVQTFANFPGFVESMMKGKLLWMRDLLMKRLLRFLPEGPSEKDLKKGKTIVYAEATNAKGEKAVVAFEGPEAYLFTAQTLLQISKNIFINKVKAGFQTPTTAYGQEMQDFFIDNIKISDENNYH